MPSEFLNIKHPDDRMHESLKTGLGGLLDVLGQTVKRGQEQSALESLLGPGAGQAVNLSPEVKKQFTTQRLAGSQKSNEREAYRQALISAGVPEKEANVIVSSPASAQKGLVTEQSRRSAEARDAERLEKARTGDAIREGKAVDRDFDTFENDLSEQRDNLRKAISDKNLDPVSKQKLRNELKDVEKQRKDIRKERQEFYGKELKEARSAYMRSKQENKTLERMEELGPEALNNWWNKLLVGLDVENIGALSNPETEEYQKLAQSFLKGAREAFGGRVSNFEVEQFMQTVPTLMNSEGGLKRIAANMRLLNKGNIARYKEIKKIKEANGGILPENYEDILDRRMKPIDKNLSQRWKKELDAAKEYAKKQGSGYLNRAAQMIPSALKTLTPIVGGGVAGATLGSRYAGIPGAIGGGLLGAAQGSGIGNLLSKLSR